ncbi:MAG: gamma carbonic anhydrase family protein [Candidatus Helarchaeota archaeon]|nr:gamma carbonic anhydrase family protein [Candidatus Helarchaeota archaeon]
MSEKPRIMKSPATGKEPKIHPSVFIAPSATVIGDVEIADGTNIWFGAVIRAEASKIKIGKNVSIQEQVVIHTEPGTELNIGDNVLMGHCAMIHGPGKIGNNVMIGISATILQNHEIEDNVLIAAGSVARGKYESMGMYAGVIAKKMKDLKKSRIRALQTGIMFYVENGRKFKAMFEASTE